MLMSVEDINKETNEYKLFDIFNYNKQIGFTTLEPSRKTSILNEIDECVLNYGNDKFILVDGCFKQWNYKTNEFIEYYVNCSPLSKLYFYNINTLKDIK